MSVRVAYGPIPEVWYDFDHVVVEQTLEPRAGRGVDGMDYMAIGAAILALIVFAVNYKP